MTKRAESSPAVVVAPRGAPLPLVTQPLQTITDDPGQTHVDDRADRPVVRIDPALSLPSRGTRAVVFGKANPVTGQAPSAPPPEIALVQHQLPPDEPLDPRLVLVRDPDSERAAAFRVLQHHLLERGQPQVVIVTSAMPGEGKTTTAANLALALAECGRARVLLAETHVRRPQLASVFRCVPAWCFAEQLAAHRHQPLLPWNLIEIPSLWLHVAAINPRVEQTQLLDAPAFAIAIGRLRQGGYDHIVIDAPPVLGSAEVNLMADAADTVALAVRAEVSTTRDLRRALDQLGAAKVCGSVLIE